VDHDLLERSINLVRAARAARAALADPTRLAAGGAVATFPVSVVAPGATEASSEHWWSFRVEREPGSVFPAGVTAVRYQGRVAGVGISGRFHVVVGDPPAGGVPDASQVTTGAAARPAWAAQLPGNIALPALSPAALRRAVARLARREAAAAEQVLAIALPFIDHLADGFEPQLRHRRSTVDRQDLVSEGWRRAYQVLGLFAGPDRPDVAWSTALYRNCRRDMARAVHALDGTSEAVATIQAAHAAHPELTEPVQLARELAVQAAERTVAAAHPDLAPDERRRRAEATAGPCRHSLQQVAWAMRAPAVVSWQDRVGRRDGIGGDGSEATVEDHWGGGEDAGLAAADAPAGAVAAALAALPSEVGVDDLADVVADLGLAGPGGPGRPRDADLARVRRRLLAPFVLPGEQVRSRAVLDRAGRRARAKLFAGGELLAGAELAAAWRAGVDAEEAARLDDERPA
jgi:hypothetical protein